MVSLLCHEQTVVPRPIELPPLFVALSTQTSDTIATTYWRRLEYNTAMTVETRSPTFTAGNNDDAFFEGVTAW